VSHFTSIDTRYDGRHSRHVIQCTIKRLTPAL
jgi:hypothetical protein